MSHGHQHQSDHEDDEHDTEQSEDDDDDDDGDAEEHVNVAVGGVHHTKLLLFIFRMSITVDETIAEQFSLDASVAARTLPVVVIITPAVLPEWSHNQRQFLDSRAGTEYEPDIHLIITSLNPLSPLDLRHPQCIIGIVLRIVSRINSTFLVAFSVCDHQKISKLEVVSLMI